MKKLVILLVVLVLLMATSAVYAHTIDNVVQVPSSDESIPVPIVAPWIPPISDDTPEITPMPEVNPTPECPVLKDPFGKVVNPGCNLR